MILKLFCSLQNGFSCHSLNCLLLSKYISASFLSERPVSSGFFTSYIGILSRGFTARKCHRMTVPALYRPRDDDIADAHTEQIRQYDQVVNCRQAFSVEPFVDP